MFSNKNNALDSEQGELVPLTLCVNAIERMFCHRFRCDRSGTPMERHSLDLFPGEDNELDFFKVSHNDKKILCTRLAFMQRTDFGDVC